MVEVGVVDGQDNDAATSARRLVICCTVIGEWVKDWEREKKMSERDNLWQWQNEKEKRASLIYAVEEIHIIVCDLIAFGNLASYPTIIQGISSQPLPLPSLIPPFMVFFSSSTSFVSMYAEYVLVYTHFDIRMIAFLSHLSLCGSHITQIRTEYLKGSLNTIKNQCIIHFGIFLFFYIKIAFSFMSNSTAFIKIHVILFLFRELLNLIEDDDIGLWNLNVRVIDRVCLVITMDGL